MVGKTARLTKTGSERSGSTWLGNGGMSKKICREAIETIIPGCRAWNKLLRSGRRAGGLGSHRVRGVRNRPGPRRLSRTPLGTAMPMAEEDLLHLSHPARWAAQASLPARAHLALHPFAKRRLCNRVGLSSASVTPRASSLGAPPLRQAAPLQQGRRALHWRRFTSLRHLRGAISRRGHDQLSALKPFVGSVRPLWRRKDIHARHHLHDLPPSRPRRSDCVSDRGYLMTPCSGIERVTSVWLSS